MSHSPLGRATALCAVLAFATTGRSQDLTPLPLPLPVPYAKPPAKTDAADSRVTVLEKGPIHEGFAQPGASVRGKGMTTPKAPPAPVEEVPPLPKPEGAGIQWIPGYWQWDAERNDFLWVCGCYRNVPPDRTWESGYWKEVKEQWTYFPGYWRPTDIKTLRANLPEPPASKEDGPTSPNANPNAMWVPGYWEHTSGKFEWRPGYWPPGSGNRLWQQGQYVATEFGFAFVPGHWDYLLEERGVLFTPVYFSPAQRAKRGWAYRPEYAISFGSDTKWGQGGAFDALSIGPNYNNYYYGHFARSASLLKASGSGEYQPWDSVTPGYTNPLWQHYVRLNRTDSGLAKGTPPPDATRSTRGTNPLAFVEPGLGCHTSCSPAPHVHWVATPIVHSGRRR
jgi:hypothetical protein